MGAIEDFQRSIGGSFGQVLQDNWILVLGAIIVVALGAFAASSEDGLFTAETGKDDSDGDGGDGGD